MEKFIFKIEASGMVQRELISDEDGNLDIPKIVHMVQQEKLMKTSELTDVLLEIVSRYPLKSSSDPRVKKDPRKELLEELRLEQNEGV